MRRAHGSSRRRPSAGLAIVALALHLAFETPAHAGLGRWRRANRAHARGYAAPAYYRTPATATSYPGQVPSAYPYRYDRFYGGNSFGNGPVPGNFGNYNPSFGIGPGAFVPPTGR